MQKITYRMHRASTG